MIHPKIPLLALAIAITGFTSIHVAAQSPPKEEAGWKTILSTKRELKDYPENQVSLEKGMLRVQAPFGIMLPLAEADGAIRARLHFLPGTIHPQLRIRSSGTPAAKDEKFYMLLFRASEKTTAITKFEVNLTAPNKAGKGLGTATLPKPLEIGGHLDLEFSMVGNRLQVLVDGNPAFDMENDFIPSPGGWGLAAANAWFSKIQVRSGPGLPAASTSTTPALARLTQLETAYTAAIQREVLDAHTQAIKDLDQKYLAALDRALEASSKAGNLDQAIIYRQEKERVLASAPLPQEENPLLKSLRETYQTSLTQLTTQRDQRHHDLRQKFILALELHQTELTQAGDLDTALTIRTRKEREMELPPSN